MPNGLTILLVDDDDDDILIFKEVIHSDIDKRINIITVSNGEQCLALLENITPDIIFLDLNMPIMGGRECYQKIRSHHDFRSIPVVIYSTTTNPAEIEQFQTQGAYFLNKPVSFSNFSEPLKAALSNYISL